MDEIISMVMRGCELARRFETDILTMASQPDSLSQSCNEIIRAFMAVQERLIPIVDTPSSLSDQMSLLRQEIARSGTLGVEERLRASSMRDMDQRVMEGHHHPQQADLTAILNAMICSRQNLPADAQMVSSIAAAGPSSSRTIGGSGDQHSGSAVRSETYPRPRKRNEREGKRTVRMAAPRIGNTEIPPEDGFTWRKYGQKEILGSRFPRAYFRCTHQKMYHCPAKKLVQRLDDDPDTFEVTYRSEHTCHMSSTAPGPSIVPISATLHELDHIDQPTPPPRIDMSPVIVPLATTTSAMSSYHQHSTANTTNSLGTWLSMDIIGPRPDASTTTTTLNPNTFLEPLLHAQQMFGSVGSSYHHQPPVMELVDAMFNSGNSSNTSMDQIFSSMLEDKWEPLQGEDAKGKKY